jgi:hypothetical protein
VVSQERNCPAPSIRVAVSAGFSKKDIDRAANVLRDCFKRVTKSKQTRFF